MLSYLAVQIRSVLVFFFTFLGGHLQRAHIHIHETIARIGYRTGSHTQTLSVPPQNCIVTCIGPDESGLYLNLACVEAHGWSGCFSASWSYPVTPDLQDLAVKIGSWILSLQVRASWVSSSWS